MEATDEGIKLRDEIIEHLGKECLKQGYQLIDSQTNQVIGKIDVEFNPKPLIMETELLHTPSIK